MQRHDVNSHDSSLGDLVSWAEAAMTDGEFEENEKAAIAEINAKDADLTHAI
jgi:hypothetical protein